MAQWLKQNTQVKVSIGPFVTDSDGVTAVTTAQTSAADAAEILAHDGLASSPISLTTDNTFTAITGATGWYKLTLTSDNLSTLGMLEVVLTDADQFLPVHKDFMVVPSNVWDSMFGSDALQVHAVEMSTDLIGATQIATDAIAAAKIAANAITSAKIAAGAITAAALASDAVAASKLATDAVDKIATSIRADIAALNNLSATGVNAEVVDALNTDTYGEPSTAPPATTTVVNKLGYLYAALRNRIDVSTGEKAFYTDTGAVLWRKALTDTGTYTEAEGTT